jgi:hypothetical protein
MLKVKAGAKRPRKARRHDEDFARSGTAIVECLAGVEGKSRSGIAPRLTFQFPTFEKPQPLAA